MEYRDMIRSVEQTTEKQIIALNDYKDRDFLSFAYNDDDLAIHILNMRQGRILISIKTSSLMLETLKMHSFYMLNPIMKECYFQMNSSLMSKLMKIH